MQRDRRTFGAAALIAGLLCATPVLADDPAASDIAIKMSGVVDYLGRKDTGKPVQVEQRQIVRELDDLIASLGDLQYGNPTKLYDAIDTSIDLLDDASGRKVVLVFSDGDDTASRTNFGDVMTKARQKEVMIYAIGLQSEFFTGQRVQRSRPSGALRRLADEVGAPKGLGDLGVTCADIPRLAQLTLSDACLTTNPRPASVTEVAELFRAAL